MEKPIYWNLCLNSDENQILMFNEHGPLFPVAKKVDERWVVDASEVKNMTINFMESDIEGGLNDLLTSGDANPQDLNLLKINITKKYYPKFAG